MAIAFPPNPVPDQLYTHPESALTYKWNAGEESWDLACNNALDYLPTTNPIVASGPLTLAVDGDATLPNHAVKLSQLQSATATDLETLAQTILTVGFTGWDLQVKDSDGSYPPANPSQPGIAEYTDPADANIKVRALYTYDVGGKVLTEVREQSANAGVDWTPITMNGAAPTGTATYIYSAVVGQEDVVIGTTWS